MMIPNTNTNNVFRLITDFDCPGVLQYFNDKTSQGAITATVIPVASTYFHISFVSIILMFQIKIKGLICTVEYHKDTTQYIII